MLAQMSSHAKNGCVQRGFLDYSALLLVAVASLSLLASTVTTGSTAYLLVFVTMCCTNNRTLRRLVHWR